MTEKQETAIQILLRLTQNKSITDEEHILLLDFIVGIDSKDPVTIIPFIQQLNPCIDPNGNGVCTNPFKDCINCPRTFDSGKGTWVSTDLKLV